MKIGGCLGRKTEGFNHAWKTFWGALRQLGMPAL